VPEVPTRPVSASASARPPPVRTSVRKAVDTLPC